MPQSEAEKLIEEVARKICIDMGEDPDCPTPYNPHVDFLWQFSLPTARAVTALIVERCAKYHDGQADGYRAHGPLPGEDSYEFQIRFHECSAGQLRSLSPTQPEAKEARDGR